MVYFKKIVEYLFLFLIGGSIYYSIEILFNILGQICLPFALFSFNSYSYYIR